MELKTFKCHKEVQASPMSLGEYNAYRGWTMPEDENPNAEGYLVIYPDSPKEGTGSGFYESWSPKEVFEQGYASIDTHVDRAVLEFNQHQNRVQKLHAFITQEGSVFSNLPEAEQQVLRKQYAGMYVYLSALAARIDVEHNAVALEPEKVPHSIIEILMDNSHYVFTSIEGTRKTTCDIVLHNGFVVGSGKSSCLNDKDYNLQVGQEIAHRNAITDAINNLYFCEGYARSMGYVA